MQNVLYCHKCGTKAAANATVCANCGTKLGSPANTNETTGSLASLAQEKDESNSSRIVYFRPRGIQGNYKLGVILGLLPTESVQFLRYYLQGSTHLAPSTPLIEPEATYSVHQSGRLISTTYVYVITQFAPGQLLRIIIQDQEVFSHQEDDYEADITGIKKKTYANTEYAWQLYTTQVLINQELKKIALYDLDALGLTPGQENAVVEAETDHIATIRHLL